LLAIITGTIRPPAGVSQLVLINEDERFDQYEAGLCSLLNTGAFSKVVFCENSNYGIEKLYHLKELAEKNRIELELLSFQGDTVQTGIHGKGYGEGEIMAYVFVNSRLAAGEGFFVKITGRMRIDNIKKIAGRLNQEKTYFNIPNRTRRDIYDTRIYAMPRKQFERYFKDSYEKIQDEQGIFLEMVYTDILLQNGIRVNNFPRYPRITGISGSNGISYGYTEWKCKIRDILSKLNFYTIR
jgi:hypothetical protein